MRIAPRYLFVIVWLVCAAAAACGARPQGAGSSRARTVDGKKPTASAHEWPEADALFRRDPRWLGGDGAGSVDLGNGRTLWLFGDSFVASREGQTRRQSIIVRNSIAIQTGANPASASIRFYWGTGENGAPASFLPGEGEMWFWPGHGIVFGDDLTLFLFKVAPNPNPDTLGFQVLGWTAVRVDGPDRDPSAWQPRRLRLPHTNSIVIGVSVVNEDGFVHAFAVREPGDHEVYIARWQAEVFETDNLTDMQWWCGRKTGWGDCAPEAVMKKGATEFSVSRAGGFASWVQVQGRGFGRAAISLRTAGSMVGPWSDFRDLYRPDPGDIPGLLVYAGKGHPQLEGADLVATYATNSLDPETLLTDDRVYFPRFVRIDFEGTETRRH